MQHWGTNSLYPQFQDRDIDSKYTLLHVPRARRVHQPLWTTPPSALVSLVACMRHAVRAALDPESVWDVLILNGPGTCFSMCAAVYLNRVSLPLPDAPLSSAPVFTYARS